MFESFSQGRYIWCHHPNGVKNALIRIWFLKVKGFCDLLNMALPVSKKKKINEKKPQKENMISKGIKFILTLTFSAKTLVWLTQKHGAIHIALLALLECVLWDNCADFFLNVLYYF